MRTPAPQFARDRDQVILLTGGINEEISSLEKKPGELFSVENYQEIDGEYHGARSQEGYERFDGVTVPSSQAVLFQKDDGLGGSTGLLLETLISRSDLSYPTAEFKYLATLGSIAQQDLVNKKYGVMSFDMSRPDAGVTFTLQPGMVGPDLQGNWTIDLVIQSQELDANAVLLYQPNMFSLELVNGQLVFRYTTTGTEWEGTVTSTNMVPVDRFYYMAVACKGTAISLFIDGARESAPDDMGAPLHNVGGSGIEPVMLGGPYWFETVRVTPIAFYNIPYEVPTVPYSTSGFELVYADDYDRELARGNVLAPDAGARVLDVIYFDNRVFAVTGKEGGNHRCWVEDPTLGWAEVSDFPAIPYAVDDPVYRHTERTRFQTFPENSVAYPGQPNQFCIVLCSSKNPAMFLYKNTATGDYAVKELEEDLSEGAVAVLPDTLRNVFPLIPVSWDNRLILAYPGGELWTAQPTAPRRYDPAIYVAAQWSFHSDITDFGISPSALLVFMEEGIDVMKVTDPNLNTGYDLSRDTFSQHSGAYPRTVQRLYGSLIWCDKRGVTTLETSDIYGDFSMASIAKRFQKTYLSNRDSIIQGVVNRDKNQYIIYASSGRGVTVTFDVEKRVKGSAFFSFAHVPTVIESAVNAPAIFFAAQEQDVVYKMHGPAASFDGEEITSSLVTSYYHYGNPTYWKHFKRLLFEIDATNYLKINVRTLYDYANPNTPKAASIDHQPKNAGGIWGESEWGFFVWGSGALVDQVYHYLSGMGVNMAVQVQVSSKYHPPHTINNVIATYALAARKY